MLIKLVDLYRRQQRDRQPYLVGRVAEFWLLATKRHDPQPGQPTHTLFISGFPQLASAKPLPPVWDAKRTRWVGPGEPDYPGFYDDFAEAVRDLDRDRRTAKS